MRKTILIALILVLTLGLMAGCRRGTSDETGTEGGMATDQDGFIGEGNTTESTAATEQTGATGLTGATEHTGTTEDTILPGGRAFPGRR